MAFLQGGFADLTNYRIGQFTIEGLTGRDNRGIPKWEVVCRYGHSQFVGHLRLAALIEAKAPNNLQCTHGGCPLSKSRMQSESLSEFLKRERREAEQQAQAEAERQKQVNAEAEKRRAEQARADALKAEYREFWLHQLKTNLPESAIPTLNQWCGFSESARRTILEGCRKDPAAEWKFTNL